MRCSGVMRDDQLDQRRLWRVALHSFFHSQLIHCTAHPTTNLVSETFQELNARSVARRARGTGQRVRYAGRDPAAIAEGQLTSVL